MPIAIPIVAAAAAVTAGSTVYAVSQQAAAQKKAQSFAEQQAAEAQAEQKRLEEKYGLTPGELEREDRMFTLEKERQTEYQRQAGKTGEELLAEAGPQTKALLDKIAARSGMTSEELFKAEGGKAGEQLLSEVTAEGPTAMFKPELELVRQMVNQEANRRGVFGGLPEGGIRFEQLGRAGVDLAINSARERLAQRTNLTNALINLSAGVRGEAATVGERALTTKEVARNELAQFLANLQNQTATAKGRAASVATQASQAAGQQTAQAYDALQGITGQQYGAASNMANTGLEALTGLTSDIFKTKTPSTGTSKVSLEDIRGTSTEYDPLGYLGEYSGGATLKKKYPYLLSE